MQQDLATPEMERLDYLEALRAERPGVEARLAALERVGDAQRVEVPYVAPHDWPSAAERRAQLRERLAAIDAELERMGG